jgi:hypothetical protein
MVDKRELYLQALKDSRFFSEAERTELILTQRRKGAEKQKQRMNKLVFFASLRLCVK